ncbi:MAG: hypothetical protein CM1200mP18_04910 [Gammaproteobacteria bacterium]|nr:MAG: hypothetical protein CM1200mP18_04910 [Gammaproteobacteria bacterium]
MVDFQFGISRPIVYAWGVATGSAGRENSARLLEVARENGSYATCYTGYNSKRDMPYWKITAVMEDLIEGEAEQA